MPTYEYQCAGCGHKFEEFQSITAKPTKRCPICGRNKVNRLISAGAGFIFKGSGFYQTDYRSDAYKAAAKSDSAPAAVAKSDTKTEAQTAPATKTEAKTEAKPAAKVESAPRAAGKKSTAA